MVLCWEIWLLWLVEELQGTMKGDLQRLGVFILEITPLLLWSCGVFWGLLIGHSLGFGNVYLELDSVSVLQLICQDNLAFHSHAALIFAIKRFLQEDWNVELRSIMVVLIGQLKWGLGYLWGLSFRPLQANQHWDCKCIILCFWTEGPDE